MDFLQALEQTTGAAEAVDRAGAFGWPRPEFPLDAGVIGGKPRVPKHAKRDDDEPGSHDLARCAVFAAEPEQRRQRHADVNRLALLEVERARLVAEHILKIINRGDGQRAAYGN